MRIFFWILGTSVTNGWCLYKRVCAQNGMPLEDQKDLLEFTSDVASSLSSKCVPKRRSRGRPSTNSPMEQVAKKPRSVPKRAPDDNIRFDGIEHWPEHRSNRPRCINYSLTAERNCFKIFHV
eukprot:Seg6986.1 transcript_id=Seg6986.1/GoldUCD/mRNA.D3Y31 product="hypothetical protein" protein_id=Seg6986.1/GoldUCD/D3Y31